MLTHEEKRELLGIAREAITEALHNRPYSPALKRSQRLLAPSGAFVTIRSGHDLRGCIGYIESNRPLVDTVAEVARKSAFDDPRFPPLLQSELEHISLEISILSPLCRIRDVDEIQVGTHGLLLELGLQRGLLLPQVATEFGWSREEFLQAVSRKAGLPVDAWKEPDAVIFVFGAEIIDEASVLHGDHGV